MDWRTTNRNSRKNYTIIIIANPCVVAFPYRSAGFTSGEGTVFRSAKANTKGRTVVRPTTVSTSLKWIPKMTSSDDYVKQLKFQPVISYMLLP